MRGDALATRYRRKEFGGSIMTTTKIITLPFGLMGSNTWLIVCPEMTIVVDPSAPLKRLPEGLPQVRLILATHGHMDHINRADA